MSHQSDYEQTTEKQFHEKQADRSFLDIDVKAHVKAMLFLVGAYIAVFGLLVLLMLEIGKLLSGG